jgi:hypothetical protein
MLLAEALAARKDATKEVEALSRRLAAAVVRYEDEPAPAQSPANVERDLTSALDRFESLTVRINEANNVTRLTFDGRHLSLMEAVALRERLVLEAKALHAAVEALEQVAGGGTGKRAWLTTRRGKDDLREVANVDVVQQRSAADRASSAVRRLDLAMQQVNWTTEVAMEPSAE